MKKNNSRKFYELYPYSLISKIKFSKSSMIIFDYHSALKGLRRIGEFNYHSIILLHYLNSFVSLQKFDESDLRFKQGQFFSSAGTIAKPKPPQN